MTQSPSTQSVQPWNTAMQEVAPNVFAYVQGGGPGIDNLMMSNAGLIVGDDQAMVVDALMAPIHAKAFRAEVDRINTKPLRHLVNTHFHLDHTYGNCFFQPIEIVAHENCRESVLQVGLNLQFFESKPEWREGLDELRLAPPTTTFRDRMTYHYGDLVIELLYLGWAHTSGDVFVYLPQHKVLFAGDVAFHYVAPLAVSGHVSGWLEVIDALNELDVETIVPGHGPVGTKRELGQMQEYFTTLKREARVRYDAGLEPIEAALDIRMPRFEQWTNPERVLPNVVRLYHEFRGEPYAPITPQEMVALRDEYARRSAAR